MPRIQQGPYNVAGDGDRVDLQVGRIESAGDRDQLYPQAGQGRGENVRAGNATVGRQEDVIVGDVRI